MSGAAEPHRAALDALRQSVLESPGSSPLSVRRAAYEGATMDDPLGAFVAKVRRDSARVTDADVSALRTAGVAEDDILEVTLAAALGAAAEILEPALSLLVRRGPDAT